MWKVQEYNPLGVNEVLHLTFVYLLKIAEPKTQIKIFCMKATELSPMSKLKTEKSIHNPFDLV